MDSPDCLLILLSISVFYLLAFPGGELTIPHSATPYEEFSLMSRPSVAPVTTSYASSDQ